jgi:hypothetical protein
MGLHQCIIVSEQLENQSKLKISIRKSINW